VSRVGARVTEQEVRQATRGLLRRAVMRWDAQHVRSAQLAPGISSLGRCRRRAAYGLAGLPADVAYEPQPKPSAAIGTWVHEGLLPLLTQELRPARRELSVEWAGLPGHVDLYPQWLSLVLDVKVVGPWQLDLARVEGMRGKDRQQVTGYADALRAEGKPAEYVGVLYVASATNLVEQDGEGHLQIEPRSPEVTKWNTVWWDEVRAAEENPDEAPRDEQGPGLSIVCDGCPFLRRCWGPDAEPGQTGPQAVITDEEIARAADEYDTARREEKAAGERKKLAAAQLRLAQGVYREHDGADGWTVGFGRPQSRMDQEAARELIEAFGMRVPYKTGDRGAISVRPAARADQ
jgi:hypothetical protein